MHLIKHMNTLAYLLKIQFMMLPIYKSLMFSDFILVPLAIHKRNIGFVALLSGCRRPFDTVPHRTSLLNTTRLF